MLGFLLAPWLARHYGHETLFKIFGWIVGIGCPINALVRVVRDYNKQLKKDEDSDSKPH